MLRLLFLGQSRSLINIRILIFYSAIFTYVCLQSRLSFINIFNAVWILPKDLSTFIFLCRIANNPSSGFFLASDNLVLNEFNRPQKCVKAHFQILHNWILLLWINGHCDLQNDIEELEISPLLNTAMCQDFMVLFGFLEMMSISIRVSLLTSADL